jgi:hypothetical protein
MKYEKYTELLVIDDYLEYEFMSIGPKGAIPKIIKFTTSQDEVIYNLVLGNKKPDGSLDDLERNNNADRNKILATVVAVLRIFFDKYPEKWVFFRGSTPERTRLYRMAITLNLEELSTDFEIVGALTAKSTFKDGDFQKGINYYGFFVQGKRRSFRKQYKVLLYETNGNTEEGKREGRGD